MPWLPDMLLPWLPPLRDEEKAGQEGKKEKGHWLQRTSEIEVGGGGMQSGGKFKCRQHGIRHLALMPMGI